MAFWKFFSKKVDNSFLPEKYFLNVDYDFIDSCFTSLADNHNYNARVLKVSSEPIFGVGLRSLKRKFGKSIFSQCCNIILNTSSRNFDDSIYSLYNVSASHVISFNRASKIFRHFNSNNSAVSSPVLPRIVLKDGSFWDNGYDALVYVLGYSSYVCPIVRWEVCEIVEGFKGEVGEIEIKKINTPYTPSSASEPFGFQECFREFNGLFLKYLRLKGAVARRFSDVGGFASHTDWGKNSVYEEYLEFCGNSLYEQVSFLLGYSTDKPKFSKEKNVDIYRYFFDLSRRRMEIFIESFELCEKVFFFKNNPEYSLIFSDFENDFVEGFIFIFDERVYRGMAE